MRALLFLSALAFSVSCFGERHDITVDKIGVVKFFDSENTLNVTWRDVGYFSLPGATNVTNCGKDNGELIVSFDLNKSELVSIILATKMSGSRIKVTVDDAVNYPTGNYCKLQFLTILD